VTAVFSAAIGAILLPARVIGDRRRVRHSGGLLARRRRDVLGYDVGLGYGAARGGAGSTIRTGRVPERSQGTADAFIDAPPPGLLLSPKAVRRAQALGVFLRMGALEPGDAARARLREAVIREHMGDAWHIIVLYDACGEPDEDGLRLAYRSVALAVDGFDPRRGASFLAYAVPVIVREVKAACREVHADARSPHRARELADAVNEAVGRLTRDLGRCPSVPELADALGATSEQIVESLDTTLGYTPAWAGPPTRAPGGVCFQAAMSREEVKVLFAVLDGWHKRALLMRSLRGMSDAQIAAELNVSRVQVPPLPDENLGALRAAHADPYSAPSDLPERGAGVVVDMHEVAQGPFLSVPGALAA
jgi:RNA polymerase sigma-B factor